MRIMKRKRGWVLIIEAVIAVLILFGFLFTAFSKLTQQSGIESREEYFYNIANELAIKAQKDDSIRDLVSLGNCEGIEEALQTINERVSIDVQIDDECELNLPTEKEIYSVEMLIATNPTDNEFKKLKIFIWEENGL